MKFFISGYFILILLLSIFSSCEEEAIDVGNLQFGQEFSVKINDQAQILSGTDEVTQKEEIQLKVVNIEDNRCPANVTCVRSGDAKVMFTINYTEVAYQLCLGDCGETSDNVTITVNGNDYLIELLGVTPYPVTGENGEKEAKFRITKL